MIGVEKTVNVLFLAAESVPFVKVGGLADVTGTLPLVLQGRGHSVRVILPHHGVIEDAAFGLEPVDTFRMAWNEGRTRVKVSGVEHNGVRFFFVRGGPFFAAKESFIYSDDVGIDLGRFLFFSAAALEFIRRSASREDWQPAIVHAHDWHTSMVPFLIRRVYTDDPVLGDLPTLLTIHNVGYQGWGIGWHLRRAGLPPVDHPLLKAMGRVDNTLAVGIAYSDIISTVSPRYAQEISTPEEGYGLDGLLQARMTHLSGILNGIDTVRWNPATSPNLAARYASDTLEDRVANKLALQAELGLPESAETPLIGAVTRLVEQKGPSIMIPAVRERLAGDDVQFVLLGSGQAVYEEQFLEMGRDHPDKVSVHLTFNEVLAERIYAGADIFLMPSLFEPCGIGQMIAMRYGALPVVRGIGGLADTVSPDDGFVFDDFHADALSHALDHALVVYRRQQSDWVERQRRAMGYDFSWESSAQRYEGLYEQTMVVYRNYA